MQEKKQLCKYVRNREHGEFALVELLEPLKSPGPIRVRDTRTNKELMVMRDMLEFVYSAPKGTK